MLKERGTKRGSTQAKTTSNFLHGARRKTSHRKKNIGGGGREKDAARHEPERWKRKTRE